jgi:hypothetical protein
MLLSVVYLLLCTVKLVAVTFLSSIDSCMGLNVMLHFISAIRIGILFFCVVILASDVTQLGDGYVT